MILSFDTIKYIDFYMILQFLQVVSTIGPNGRRYVSVGGSGFSTAVAQYLPGLASYRAVPVIPLSVFLIILVYTKLIRCYIF